MAAGLTGENIQGFIVPRANSAEAAIASPVPVFPAENLEQVSLFLQGVRNLEAAGQTDTSEETPPPGSPDLSEVRGQQLAKRALEVAAAGGTMSS